MAVIVTNNTDVIENSIYRNTHCIIQLCCEYLVTHDLYVSGTVIIVGARTARRLLQVILSNKTIIFMRGSR